MTRRTLPAVVSIAVAVLGLGSCVPAARAQPLNERFEGAVAKAKLGKTKLACVVMDAQTERVLVARNANEAMIPASNMKLLTSGAAALVLGPQFSFRTELVYQAAGSPGVPAGGRLILRGSGDPALGDPKLLGQMGIGVEDLISHWVEAARKTGAASFEEVVIDDRVFDREFRHPTWPVGQANRWYCAEVSGLIFYANLLAIYPSPQAPGSPAVLKTEPSAPWIEIRNKTKSIRQGQQTIWATWTNPSEVTTYGDVRYSTDPVELALNNSPEFVTRLLGDRLRRAGFQVGTARLAGENEALAGGSVIQVVQTPLATVLARCNMDSYNLYAEALIKRMGHEVAQGPGSWKTGAAVVRMKLAEKLGAEAGRGIQVADGSGMSRENKVTASLLAKWLIALAKDTKASDLFVSSLPRTGEGTMESRFESKRLKNEVRAKSGYISGVCTLSGYVTDPSTGQRLVFSILTNDKPGGVSVASIKAFQEDVVAICDRYLTSQRDDEAQGGR